VATGWDLVAAAIGGTLGGGILVVAGNAAIAWFRRPVLRIDFEETESYAARTPINWPNTDNPDEPLRLEAIYLRARVVNVGKSTARACRAYITRIRVVERRGDVRTIDDMDSVQIPWSLRTADDNSIAVLDLPVGINQFADIVFTISRNSPEKLFPGAIVFPHRFRSLFAKPGRFEMTVLVVADNATAVEREIAFDWQGPWDTLRPIKVDQ